MNCKVKIINPEVLRSLYKNWGEFACQAYATSKKYAEKVGHAVAESQHFSGSRCEYTKFEIEADRGTIEQFLRTEIGARAMETNQYHYMDMIETYPRISPDEIVKNAQSFRYVDKNDFVYTIPHNIEKSERANECFVSLMNEINSVRKKIRDILIEEDINPHKAVEDANFVLPRATHSKTTIGFTPEALIRFMNKRLCVRAQDEIREVAIEMKKAITEINPEFAKELMPHCQYLTWCPEGKKSCGAYPTREQRLTQIQLDKYSDSNNFKEDDE